MGTQKKESALILRLFFVKLFLFVIFSLAGQEYLPVRKIHFQGNKTLDKRILKEQLFMKEVSRLREKVFKKEIVSYTSESVPLEIKRLKAFYQKEGFLNVEVMLDKVKVSRNEKGVELIYVIHEGEPIIIKNISYHFTDTVLRKMIRKPAKQWKAKRALKIGKRFRDEDVLSDKKRLITYLSNKGYPYLDVNIKLEVDALQKEVSLFWNVEPGPICFFGGCDIEGNESLSTSFLNRYVAFEKGEVYKQEKLEKTQEYLYDLGRFKVVSVRGLLAREEKKDTIPVKVTLKEADRSKMKVGVGYGREDRLRAFIDYTYLGFLGGARRANFFAKHSYLEPYHFAVTFTQPSLLGPASYLDIKPFILKKNEPGYILESRGMESNVTKHYGWFLDASLGYYFEENDLDTTSVAQSPDTLVIDDYYNKSGINGSLFFDKARPKFDPDRGFIVGGNFMYSGFGSSSYKYLRLVLEFRHYVKIKYPILAWRVKGGNIWTGEEGFIPYEDRFYVGGSNSVRGWGRSLLGPKDEKGTPVGGKSFMEFSVEERIPVSHLFMVGLFLEGGNVWMEAEKWNFKDLHFAAGGGIRIKTPIGPIRFDVGWPIFDQESGAQFHFSVGHPF